MAYVYWASTKGMYGTGWAWVVIFWQGDVGGSDKSYYGYYVRAVRGGYSNNSFIDNGNGTITDTGTGLMWQKATVPGTYTWEQALTYCENLTLAGYSDWRLPNRNELQSIVDYSTYNPAIDTTFFSGTMLSYYWSSTTYVYDINAAWPVGFHDGSVSVNGKSVYYYVRAVRGGQGGPTVIDLSSFTATPKAGKVIIQWATESETDNAGFNIYRSSAEDGEYEKINDALITAQGSPTQGTSYEFIDKGLRNGRTYYYKLEDIDLNGTSTMHGPVHATPRWILGLWN